MRPIAYIRTDLPQKFGIPRNSFLAPDLEGRIVFEPEFALPAAVAGLEGFSHLWLLWAFENGLPGGGAEDVAGVGDVGVQIGSAVLGCAVQQGLGVLEDDGVVAV